MLHILTLLLMAATLTGCGSLIQREPEIIRPANTNVVTVYTTNIVVVTESYKTNAGMGTVFTTIPPTIAYDDVGWIQTKTNIVVTTNTVTNVFPAVLVTNLAINPALAATAQTVANAVPVPWLGGAVQILLAVAGVGFGWWNRHQKNKALGQAQTWETTANVLVDNVETIRTAAKALPAYTQEVDDKVMKGVMMAQQAAGVAHAVYDIVQTKKDEVKQ